MKYLLIALFSLASLALNAQATEANVRAKINNDILTNRTRLNSAAKLREVLHEMMNYMNARSTVTEGLIRYCVPQVTDNTGAMTITSSWTEIPEFALVAEQGRNYWIDMIFTTIFGTANDGTIEFKLEPDNPMSDIGRVMEQSGISVNHLDGTTVRRNLKFENQFGNTSVYPYHTGDSRTLQHIAGYIQNATATDTVRFYLRAAPGTTFNIESGRKMCVNGY